MNQPSIEIFDFLIIDPVNTLTDLFVSLVYFYAFYQLGKLQRDERVYILFRYYFLVMGISILLGGLFGHAFQHYLGPVWKLPGWLLSMFAIYLLEQTAIFHAKPLLKPRTATVFQAAALMGLLLFFFIVLYTEDFRYIGFHSAFGMVVITFTLNAFIFWRTKNVGSQYILLAIFITSISGFIFAAQISISPWFNHLDICHVFLALAAWVFYLAARNLELVPERIPTKNHNS